jgi:hypothetical protein
MDLKEKTLERIIHNERLVTQLESMYTLMRKEIGGYKNYVTSSSECRKYGIDFAGLTSEVLGCYLKLKEINKQK